MKNLSAIVYLFIANTISGVAQGISMLAIPWYFTQQEDMSRFGIIYIVINCIALFWVPYCGTFIDRYNRKNIFLIVTTVCGLSLCAIAGLGYYWGALPWYLVAVVFGITFLNYNLHYPNLYAFVQEITEEKYYSKITSYIEIQGQLSSMAAGAGAALLLEGTQGNVLTIFGFNIPVGFEIEPWLIHEIFLLDASTYLLGFLFIAMIKYVPLTSRSIDKGSVWEQLQIGYQFLKNNINIFIFGVASYSIFVTIMLEGFYLGAQYVDQHLLQNGTVYASSTMYYAVGAVLAGAGVHWLFRKATIPMAIIVMTLTTAVVYYVLYDSTSTMIYYAGLLILGLTNAGTRVLRSTYLFRHIPNQVYGRASSIFFLSNISFRILFISLFALPFFQFGNNVIYAFAILSIFLLISAVVLVKYYPSFTSLKKPLVSQKASSV